MKYLLLVYIFFISVLSISYGQNCKQVFENILSIDEFSDSIYDKSIYEIIGVDSFVNDTITLKILAEISKDYHGYRSQRILIYKNCLDSNSKYLTSATDSSMTIRICTKSQPKPGLFVPNGMDYIPNLCAYIAMQDSIFNLEVLYFDMQVVLNETDSFLISNNFNNKLPNELKDLLYNSNVADYSIILKNVFLRNEHFGIVKVIDAVTVNE